MLDRLREGVVPTDDREWRDPLVASPGFGPLEERRFRHAETTTVEAAVERVATSSVVAVLPEAEREDFLARVRSIVRGQGEEVTFRYRTDVFVTEAFA
jgi:hypothetical protein